MLLVKLFVLTRYAFKANRNTTVVKKRLTDLDFSFPGNLYVASTGKKVVSDKEAEGIETRWHSCITDKLSEGEKNTSMCGKKEKTARRALLSIRLVRVPRIR